MKGLAPLLVVVGCSIFSAPVVAMDDFGTLGGDVLREQRGKESGPRVAGSTLAVNVPRFTGKVEDNLMAFAVTHRKATTVRWAGLGALLTGSALMIVAVRSEEFRGLGLGLGGALSVASVVLQGVGLFYDGEAADLIVGRRSMRPAKRTPEDFGY